MKVIVDCKADLHGHFPEMPGGDILIVAGDCTGSDTMKDWCRFFEWFKKQQYEKKILVAGNHDNFLEEAFPKNSKEADDLHEVQGFLHAIDEYEPEDFEYLCDSQTECFGLKIWGTPWTPWFRGVHPKCKAFMENEIYLSKRFQNIPEGLDILISHGPMHHVLDANFDGYHCGSSSLSREVDRTNPRFHVFGHIHEQGGTQIKYDLFGANTWCANCSHVDEHDKPTKSSVRLEITPV